MSDDEWDDPPPPPEDEGRPADFEDMSWPTEGESPDGNTTAAAGLSTTALGELASIAANNAYVKLVQTVAGKMLTAALPSPAGEPPAWPSTSEDPDSPSWGGAITQSVQEAITANLMATLERPDGWEAEAPELVYPNLVGWVHGWLVPTYRRETAPNDRNRLWCREWWKHPEVVIRLSALWRGWEQRRTEPGDAMSAWLRDHLDHHMPMILDETGPFRGCDLDKHSSKPLKAWPITEPPADLIAYLG